MSDPEARPAADVTKPGPRPVADIIADIVVEYTSARAKHSLESDRNIGGVHRLIGEASRRTRGPGCGFYHREGLIEAAGILIAAIELLDTSTDYPHDCGPR